MKKLLPILLLAALLLSACAAKSAAPADGASVPASSEPEAVSAPAEEGVSAREADAAAILLTGDGAEIHSGGVKAEGNVITVAAVGEYRISGELREGQIVVDTGEDPVDVTLILDGVKITNPSGPALWVRQAKNVYLRTAAGTDNVLCSGTEADLASYDDTRSGAAVFAEDDLFLEGEGSLTILGWLNNGVTCKDDLKIRSGSLTVKAANNGLRASESVRMSGGELRVEAGNDGLKTSSDKKAGKGFIEIAGGSLSITAGDDGIQAVTDLTISGGKVRIDARKQPMKAGGLMDVSVDVEIAGG